MGLSKTFGWTDVRRIAEELADQLPGKDPVRVGFPELRQLVIALPGFKEEAGHPSNERILEEIQRHWMEERSDRRDDEDED